MNYIHQEKRLSVQATLDLVEELLESGKAQVSILSHINGENGEQKEGFTVSYNAFYSKPKRIA